MHYILSYENPEQHFIDFELIIENNSEEELLVQLPAWRPGRYELSNFAKNVRGWKAFDAQGNPLKHEKQSKDLWKVFTEGNKKIHVRYSYFAAELNAGSTYLDEEQLYVNPVNCCCYVPDRIGEECTVELKIPESYRVATGMKIEDNLLQAKDFHELADSPFIASPSLKHHHFECEGTAFHLWFQGESKPDFEKIAEDFQKYTVTQLEMMGDFPFREYHYFFQIVPYRAYHGVEHVNSTVILLGPSYDLMNENVYPELLGVSSHELFHAWNIKTIRPVEMMPYDYTRENYSRLGYVAEGVTTYYGDLHLYRSGVFSNEQYFQTLNQQMQRHFDNFGRHNLSVADSSYDTWLDGYQAGVPNRKVSIYTEGCLVALMSDMKIRQHTDNEKSLDDVLSELYHSFGKKGRGYSEQDYKMIMETIASASFDEFFEKYVWGTHEYEPLLTECLNYIGCRLERSDSQKSYESDYGFKVLENNGREFPEVCSVYPGAIAEKAGLTRGDVVMAVNGYPLKNDFTEWCRYFRKEKLKLTIKRNAVLFDVILEVGDQFYFRQHAVIRLENPEEWQKINFRHWSKRDYVSDESESGGLVYH